MKWWRDVLGLVLLITGVGGCMTGVRGLSGTDDVWWGAPAMGAGVVANVLAYRTMRPPRAKPEAQAEQEQEQTEERES